MCGAIIVFAAGALGRAPGCLQGIEPTWYALGMYAGVFVLGVAAVALLRSTGIHTFDQFDLPLWVTSAKTRRSGDGVVDLLEEIAASYRDYTVRNRALNDSKAARLEAGLRLLILGVAVIAGTVVWSGCGLPRLW